MRAARGLVAASMVAGCGGKIDQGSSEGGTPPPAEASNGAASPNVNKDPNAKSNVPRCDAICTHVVGACAAGASIDACTADCRVTETMTKCPGERDVFLECMLTAEVRCSAGNVLIVGCSDERNALEHCAP